jgi:tRNA U34 5-methylaminomethyl-2-thiouridine-forming methyltransferase MnmC
MKTRDIIKTKDGSHTIYIPELDETYHSGFGAMQEAEHIFIREALAFYAGDKRALNILEIGFGTGLNAYLSLLFSKERELKINYCGVEKYPLELKEIEALNYFDNEQLFLKLHQIPWNAWQELGEHFRLYKLQSDFRRMILETENFDVVYFDAFAPDVQPHLWTEDIFRKIYDSMKRGGVLTTYSVKGSVRRAMKSVGFEVKKIPGPPGKREITRAIKI